MPKKPNIVFLNINPKKGQHISGQDKTSSREPYRKNVQSENVVRNDNIRKINGHNLEK